MRVLITGITGLAGTTLYNFLSQNKSIHLFGTFRAIEINKNSDKNFKNATFYECDVQDFSSVKKIIKEINPDLIFHFAAYVSVYKSLSDPTSAYQTNICGTVNLLESVRTICPNSKILIPGSSEEYGRVPEKNMPITENYRLSPTNPYGMSKKIQEEIGIYYFKNYGLPLYFTRTFYCTGPGQPLGFVCSDFAKQIVDVENQKLQSIKVGNLDAKRDFTDIRDIIEAYWAIIHKGKAGEIYNVCSGKLISIKEILNTLIRMSGQAIKVVVDEAKLRPSEVPVFFGDNMKLTNIGWKPTLSIDDSLRDVLNWWKHEGK